MVRRFKIFCLKILKRVKKFIEKRGYKLFLPLLYISGLFISVILSGLYVVFPSLVFCSSLFGQRFCTLAGVYIASIISLPGYFIAGYLFNIPPETKWSVSLIYVIFSSILFYFLLGLILDKVKESSASRLSKIIIIFFILLLIIFLFLLAKTPPTS